MAQTKALLCKKFPNVIGEITFGYFMPKLDLRDRSLNIREVSYAGVHEICEQFTGHDARVALPEAASGDYFLLVKKLCENNLVLTDDDVLWRNAALWRACALNRWDIMDYLAENGATKCGCRQSLESHKFVPPMGPMNKDELHFAKNIGNGKIYAVIAMTNRLLQENDSYPINTQIKGAILEGIMSRRRG